MPQVIEPPTRTLSPYTPPRLRWTADQFESLFTMGLLPESKYELIDGDVIPKMPTKHPHARVIALFFGLLTPLFGIDYLLAQFSLRIDSENVPEPDFAVTSEATDELPEDGYTRPEDIRLVVEVSATTLDTDLTTKARLYGAAGIPEYWVVDVEGQRLLVHREPVADGYSEVIAYAPEDTVSPLSAPNANLMVGSLLP